VVRSIFLLFGATSSVLRVHPRMGRPLTWRNIGSATTAILLIFLFLISSEF
jgi:hypothetical protein